jgi:hypothetical protein
MKVYSSADFVKVTFFNVTQILALSPCLQLQLLQYKEYTHRIIGRYVQAVRTELELRSSSYSLL